MMPYLNYRCNFLRKTFLTLVSVRQYELTVSLCVVDGKMWKHVVTELKQNNIILLFTAVEG